MNPFDILKNFSNIQEKIQEMQGKLSDVSCMGSSGAGMVQVEIDGQLSIKKVTISPEALEGNDLVMLSDLVQAAVNDAITKMKEKLKTEFSSGIGLPPGLLG